MSTPIQPIDWQWLPEVLPHLQVVHHIHGRLRLRLLPGILAILPNLSGNFLKTKLATLPGILELRINKPAASLLIVYDPQRIQATWWERLLSASSSEIPHILTEMDLLYALPLMPLKDKK